MLEFGRESLIQAIAITALFGGTTGWLTGRAIAWTWRPFWQVLLTAPALAAAVRFIHFALFSAPLFNLGTYLSDLFFLLIVMSLGWRFTRARQMATQYYWLYQQTSPLTWARRGPSLAP